MCCPKTREFQLHVVDSTNQVCEKELLGQIFMNLINRKSFALNGSSSVVRATAGVLVHQHVAMKLLLKHLRVILLAMLLNSKESKVENHYKRKGIF